MPCGTSRTVICRLCEALILTPGALYFSQKFIAAVVQRFQNINPDSDGAHIKGPRNLKNEIQIITLPTELWTSWKTFLNKHTEGELINPDTDKMFKKDKKFKLKQQTLKREFFKHCGHFTDRNFGVLAQHLIGATPARTIVYLSHPLQVPPLWYISLNGGNRTEAFNLALARVTMHQPHMGHTHVRLALNFLYHQSKLGTYPQSLLVHLLVDRGWLGADFHTCPRPF